MVVAKIEAVLGAATKTKMSMNSSEKDRRPPEKTSIFGEIILFLKVRPFSMNGSFFKTNFRAVKISFHSLCFLNYCSLGIIAHSALRLILIKLHQLLYHHQKLHRVNQYASRIPKMYCMKS